MSFRLKNLLLTSVAALVLGAPAFAQVTGVEGEVKGADGNPVVGAVVKFERKDIKGNYNVKSNKKGHFGHYGLPLGTYKVSVEVDGKVRDSVDNFRTKLGDPQQLNFDLKQQADQQQALQKAAETGTLTKEQERGMTKEQKDAFDKAAKAREAALSKNKALNDAFQAGKAAMEAKNYDQAIEQFTKASEMDATQTVVWAQLADAYIQQANAKPTEADALRQKGFDAYKKAIELKPDEAPYYNNYALALAKAKKLDEAKTNLDKAAQLDAPNAGKYFYNMGALLVNSGQNDAAGEEFKKAIAADPNYADAQYQYGVYLAAKATSDKSGKIIAPPGATDALQKYLDLKPEGPYAPSAKEMITQLGGTVSTTYSNPNAPQKKTTKKK